MPKSLMIVVDNQLFDFFVICFFLHRAIKTFFGDLKERDMGMYSTIETINQKIIFRDDSKPLPMVKSVCTDI